MGAENLLNKKLKIKPSKSWWKNRTQVTEGAWSFRSLITHVTLGRSYLPTPPSTHLDNIVLTWCSQGPFQNPDIFWLQELQLLGADYSCHLVAESETSLWNKRAELSFLRLMKEEGGGEGEGWHGAGVKVDISGNKSTSGCICNINGIVLPLLDYMPWLFFFFDLFIFIFGCVGSSLLCAGFSLRWLLLLRSTGSRHVDFSSCGSWAQ